MMKFNLRIHGGGVGPIDNGEGAEGDCWDEIDEEWEARNPPPKGDDSLRGLTEEEYAKVFSELNKPLETKTLYFTLPLRRRTSSHVLAVVQSMFLRDPWRRISSSTSSLRPGQRTSDGTTQALASSAWCSVYLHGGSGTSTKWALGSSSQVVQERDSVAPEHLWVASDVLVYGRRIRSSRTEKQGVGP